MNKTERNITLDYFKIILAILVIIIHLPLDNSFSKAVQIINNDLFINGICRMAVPCFFVINGYFLKIDESYKVKKYLKHIGIMYIVWTLLYLPFAEIDSLRTFIIIFIGGFIHLWYLAALFQSVIIIYMLKKVIKNDNIILIISFVLFSIGYFIQSYYPYPTWVDLYKFRNFLFLGIPFFFIGYLIKKWDVDTHKKIILKLTFLISILFAFEIILTYKLQEFYSKDFYISLIFLCPLLIKCVINYSKYAKSNNELGSLSSAMYLSHIFIIFISYQFFSNAMTLPFVILMTILFSYLVIYANKSLKIFL